MTQSRIASRLAFLLGSLCVLATSAAVARDIRHLSPADDGGCTAELAAAKADATEKQDAAATRRTTGPAAAPVRSQPAVRGGGDAAPSGSRLQAPRWHSFLPGMFR